MTDGPKGPKDEQKMSRRQRLIQCTRVGSKPDGRNPPAAGFGSREPGPAIAGRVVQGYTIVYPWDTLQVMALVTKDAGLRLRVEKALRQQFVDACRADGRTAAEVMREFMRTYVAERRMSAQADLFSAVRDDVGDYR